MKNIFTNLIDDYGEDKVLTAAKDLLAEKLNEKAPGPYADLVHPEKIKDAVHFIDETLKDVAEAGKAVEDAYGDRRSLIQQIAQLNTSIELTEAEAFMLLEGNKVEVDGKVVTLSNDKMRDMYRKYVSREERTRLTELESELKAIEIDTFKAKDRWDETKITADLVKARAFVQANLLQFLS